MQHTIPGERLEAETRSDGYTAYFFSEYGDSNLAKAALQLGHDCMLCMATISLRMNAQGMHRLQAPACFISDRAENIHRANGKWPLHAYII